MKDFYKISEISRLYGVGPDALRYYERLGLLRPRRDEANGYRLYGLRDIYKLSVIRDLRALGLPMAQIKDYLEGQSVEATLDMLGRERALLSERIAALEARRAALSHREAALARAKELPEGEIQVLELPDRPAVALSEYITRDEEMDFVIKRLHQRHERRLQDFGDLSVGAFFSMEDLARGLTNRYRAVFLLLPEGEGDLLLPGGPCLSLYYRGSYQRNGERARTLLAWAAAEGWTAAGDAYELYHIDNRHTARPEEFLTEIQLPVRRAAEGRLSPQNRAGTPPKPENRPGPCLKTVNMPK